MFQIDLEVWLYLSRTTLCVCASNAMYALTRKFFQLNRPRAFHWEYFQPRLSMLRGGRLLIKLQGRFGTWKHLYFGKQFSAAYSTGFRVPKTRKTRKNIFFWIFVRRSLIKWNKIIKSWIDGSRAISIGPEPGIILPYFSTDLLKRIKRR